MQETSGAQVMQRLTCSTLIRRCSNPHVYFLADATRSLGWIKRPIKDPDRRMRLYRCSSVIWIMDFELFDETDETRDDGAVDGKMTT